MSARTHVMRHLLTLSLASCSSMIEPAVAQPAKTYPLVLSNADQLLDVGIGRYDVVAHGALSKPKFNWKNNCYGQSDSVIAVSDTVLAHYKAKGFSLRTLCMGLMSEIRFNPETGKRLASYVIINETARVGLLKALKGRDLRKMTAQQLDDCCGEWTSGMDDQERPLAIPTCFKNGTPYLDCVWRYGVKTGVKIAQASTDRFGAYGRALDAAMKRALERGVRPCPPTSEDVLNSYWPCSPTVEADAQGMLRYDHPQIRTLVETYVLKPGALKSLAKNTDATFVDISPEFPLGYGYALHALSGEGLGAPGVSSAVMAAVFGGEPVSQISAERLKSLLDDE
jgi:hypothetical protein